MKYDITKPVRPKMPKLGRGLESVNLLLSQVSKLMHEPLAPTVFPHLGLTSMVVNLCILRGYGWSHAA